MEWFKLLWHVIFVSKRHYWTSIHLLLSSTHLYLKFVDSLKAIVLFYSTKARNKYLFWNIQDIFQPNDQVAHCSTANTWKPLSKHSVSHTNSTSASKNLLYLWEIGDGKTLSKCPDLASYGSRITTTLQALILLYKSDILKAFSWRKSKTPWKQKTQWFSCQEIPMKLKMLWVTISLVNVLAYLNSDVQLHFYKGSSCLQKWGLADGKLYISVVWTF